MFKKAANVGDVQGSPKNELSFRVWGRRDRKINKEHNNIKVDTFLREVPLIQVRDLKKEKRKEPQKIPTLKKKIQTPKNPKTYMYISSTVIFRKTLQS